MVPSYHLTFTSQKGTPLLVHPMLATLGHRSGYLQDGAIVPSDLLTSQKGTPLLVHPMLHPNIGSPRDTATLGGYRLCLPCHPCFATTISVFICFLHLPTMEGGGDYNVVTHITFLLVWASSQIIIVGTVRSAPPPVRAWLQYINLQRSSVSLKIVAHKQILEQFVLSNGLP